MDLETGRRNRLPVAQLVRRRLKELEPHARELGSERELEGVQGHPRSRKRRRPPAPRLQREPGPRRGRPRARRRDRGRRGHRVTDLSPPGPRMDLVGESARIVSARWWAPAGRSAPGFGARKRDQSRTSRLCSASTGLVRIEPRISSSRTEPPPRTSPRRPSSPRCATWTASIAADLSGPGCTGSSSTGRSTGPARGRCGGRRRRSRAPMSSTPATRHVLAGRRGRARLARRGAPRRDRAPLPPRVHAR